MVKSFDFAQDDNANTNFLLLNVRLSGVEALRYKFNPFRVLNFERVC